MTTVQNATFTVPSPADTATPRSEPTPARITPDTELTLLLDVGSAWTKAALVGRAGGRWRIVCGTAQPTSWGESVLVEDLVGRLTPHTDARLSRQLAVLVREAPRITCRSPRRPGRVAIAARATSDLASATTLATRSGWTVEAGVAGDDRRTAAEQFDLLRRADVDAWLVVPGANAREGNLWGAVVAARGPSAAPVLVVSPDEDPAPWAMLFTTGARWVAPAIDDQLAAALLRMLTSINALTDVRATAPLAFSRSIDALAGGLGLTVLGVDLGASWLAWREAGGREGGRTALTAADHDRIMPEGSRAAAEILPTDVDEFTTTDAMAGLEARRAGIPATPVELAIAQAIGIDRLAAARHTLGGSPAVDLVVGGGRLLAGAAHAADAALVLLDGLRPSGVTQLAIDPWGICGPLGALADTDVDEALETLRDDLLIPLGTAVVSQGGQGGQIAFRARLHRPGWPDSPQVEVRTGSVAVLPLERGGSGDIVLEVERGVHVGAAPRGPRMRAAVTGGAVGVILDARGDPIQLPARPGDAQAMVQTWRDALRRETRAASTG
jgi:hypothetical protein